MVEQKGIKDNSSITGVKSLLGVHGLFLKKSLGQNFLVDKNIRTKIVEACQLREDDTVLEVGTGLGVLSVALAEKAKKVTTVEIDSRLEPILRQIFSSQDNITLIMNDILQLDWEKTLEITEPQKVVVCANLPYYITSPVIFNILDHLSLVKRAVLMMQKEVAERLLARPGTKEYGLITAMVTWKATVSPVTRVSRNCYYPVPEVDSSVVRLEPRESLVEVKDEEVLRRLVRDAFQMRRKTMNNVLCRRGLSRDDASMVLMEAGIDPMCRGETLSIEEFARIADGLTDRGKKHDFSESDPGKT